MEMRAAGKPLVQVRQAIDDQYAGKRHGGPTPTPLPPR
jgi:hypothetical protein